MSPHRAPWSAAPPPPMGVAKRPTGRGRMPPRRRPWPTVEVRLATRPSDARELLEQGIRYERGGALDKALVAYAAVAEGAGEPPLRAEALRRSADVLRTRCDWDGAVAAARRSARLARDAQEVDLLAEALNAEAAVYQSRGEMELARPLLEEALERARTPRVEGIVWQNLGFLAATDGDFAQAEACFRRASQRCREARYVRGEVMALVNTGRAALDQGKVELGTSLCEEGLDAARRELDLELAAVAAVNYADALLALDRLEEALDLTSEAMGYFGTLPNPWRQTECLRLLGDIHSRLGEQDVAQRCYGQGLELARELGASVEEELLEERLRELAG